MEFQTEKVSDAVKALAHKYLKPYRIREGQLIAKVCPFCKGGDNGDEYTFAVGLYNGAYNCMRGHCNVKGSFRDLCDYFGEESPEDVAIPQSFGKKKMYVRPSADELLPRTEQIDTYFANRCISEETLDAFKIAADTNGNIVFPFYRDDKLIFVKYREPVQYKKGSKKPKEWQVPGTEEILFGMDNVSFNKPLIITEGQIDAMAVWEAGFHNVVSVPGGANRFEWVDNCWDWLEKFQQIILFGDSDEPGVMMVNTLMKRLGEDRCMVPPEYPELIVDGVDKNRICKDANEILYAYGKEGIIELIDQCKAAPVQGVLNLADVAFVDPTTVPRIYTRIPDLDQAIGGLGEGELIVLTGKRGEGKSTIGGTLLLNAVEQGYNTCAYSGELSAWKFLEWILLQATESQYVGVTTDARNGRKYATVSPEIQQRIRAYINHHMYLFDNSYTNGKPQQKTILEVFDVCARRYGCKLFLVDNMLVALNCSAQEENKAQADFAAALKAFAVKYRATVILVAHPRKTMAGQKLTNDDVAGSAAISNLADTVIAVEKPNLRVMKNRNFGDLRLVECSYNPVNRRIYQTSIGDKIKYSWDRNGIKAPEVLATSLPEFKIMTKPPERAPF